MTELTPHSWSDWSTGKKLIRKRYRHVWDLPLINEKHLPITHLIRSGMKILDMGAGNREFATKVLQGRTDVVYRSMDVDCRHPHDYHSLDEIQERFDLVMLMEVIEHLTQPTAETTLRQIHSLLNPEGILAVSTPNIHNPALFLSDPTHCLYLNYESCGALLMMTDFEVHSIYRTYSASLLKRWGRWLATPLFRLLNLDYTTSILILAKPLSPTTTESGTIS